MRRLGAAVVAILTLAASVASGASIARLTLSGPPGEPITNGRSYDLVFQQPDDNVTGLVRSSLAGGEPALLQFHLSSGATPGLFADLFFGTDTLNLPMQPGFYPNALETPPGTLGHPGFLIALEGRGPNDQTGQFTVEDVAFAADGTIRRFVVDLVQQAYPSIPLSASGRLVYLPEPAGLLSIIVACLPIAWRRHRVRC